MEHCFNRKKSKNLTGKEIFEITPVILGGDPNDPKNKTLLTREAHFEAVRYWNAIIGELKEKRKDEIQP